MKKEAQNWREHGKRDLETAEHTMDSKDYYASSFFSQQAVEKALKALYVKKFNELVRVHDMVFLARELELPRDLIDAAKRLNPVYVESGYPDVSGSLSAYSYAGEDASEDLSDVNKIIKWLHGKI
ncbi:MAG: HEPN domain-containing protein [Candidatus Altiarchaeota archaeon]|nr:HEPN domain-containing protein [Candidatus Altiarchaeota archaeon]